MKAFSYDNYRIFYHFTLFIFIVLCSCSRRNNDMKEKELMNEYEQERNEEKESSRKDFYGYDQDLKEGYFIGDFRSFLR